MEACDAGTWEKKKEKKKASVPALPPYISSRTNEPVLVVSFQDAIECRYQPDRVSVVCSTDYSPVNGTCDIRRGENKANNKAKAPICSKTSQFPVLAVRHLFFNIIKTLDE